MEEQDRGGLVDNRGAKDFAGVNERAREAARGNLDATDDAMLDIEEEDAKVLDAIVECDPVGDDGAGGERCDSNRRAIFYADGTIPDEGNPVRREISQETMIGWGWVLWRLVHGLAPCLGGRIASPHDRGGARGPVSEAEEVAEQPAARRRQDWRTRSASRQKKTACRPMKGEASRCAWAQPARFSPSDGSGFWREG